MNRYLSVLLIFFFAISASANAAEKYQVNPGDTLWVIAKKYKPATATTQQMIVAIYDNNPKAFNYQNLNSLRPDAVLEIPDSDQVVNISNVDANKEINQQYKDWKSGVRNTSTQATKKSNSKLQENIASIQTQIQDVKSQIKDTIKDLEASNNILKKGI